VSIDRFECLEFVAVRELNVLELPRLDEDVSLEGSDRFVVGVDRPTQAAPELLEVTSELADCLVELPPVIGDLLRVARDRLLLPSVRNRPEQRNERRRTRGDDVLFDAELDE
jgi:hypothetical protein